MICSHRSRKHWAGPPFQGGSNQVPWDKDNSKADSRATADVLQMIGSSPMGTEPTATAILFVGMQRTSCSWKTKSFSDNSNRKHKADRLHQSTPCFYLLKNHFRNSILSLQIVLHYKPILWNDHNLFMNGKSPPALSPFWRTNLQNAENKTGWIDII